MKFWPPLLVVFLFGCVAVPVKVMPTFQTASVAATMPCFSHKDIQEKMQDIWKEELRTIGVTKSGQLFQTSANERGEWTAMLVLPQGQTCIIAAGDGWRRK